jgi:ABC-2 type transport system permease protein
MRQFGAFIIKEFRHILRDRRTLLILLGMTVVQILLFGFAISTEVKETRVAVWDPAPTVESQRIVEQLDASPYFAIIERLASANRVDEVWREGVVGLVVVFDNNAPSGSGGGVGSGGGLGTIQLIADATDPNQALTVTGYAGNIINSTTQAPAAQAVTQGSSQGSQGMSPPPQPEIRVLYNPQGRSAFNFVPGVMGLILTLICAMMTAIAIVREKETGTMEILLASPARPMCIIISKAVPYLVLSLANLTTILLLSIFVLDVPVAGSVVSMLVVSLVFIITALSLGLLISTLVNSQMAAMLASGMGLIMPTMLLSGLIFPIESMPRVLQWASCVVPARWYIDAVRRIMIQGVELRFVLTDIVVLAGMATAFIAVSMRNFKTRLQ